MSLKFDPYHRWLGIAPEEQPADHYRLLGLKQFEDDADVIESAADKQMAHVRTFQMGKHADDARRILNEISSAKLALLQRDKKQAYDTKLKLQAKESPKSSVVELMPAINVPPVPKANAAPIVTTTIPTVASHKSPTPTRALLIIAPAVLSLLLITGMLLVFSKPWERDNDDIASNSPDSSPQGDVSVQDPGANARSNSRAADPNRNATTNRDQTNEGTNVSPPTERLPANLLELVDSRKHALHQVWSQQDGGVTAPNAFAALLALPVAVDGSYELNVEFTRNHGTGLVAVVFPVGDRYSSFLLAAGRGEEAIFDGQDQGRVSPSRLTNGQRYTVTIQTILDGLDVELRVLVDGDPYTSWKGPISDLNVDKHRQLPDLGRVGLYAHMASTTFHTLSVRSDGERVLHDPLAVEGDDPY